MKEKKHFRILITNLALFALALLIFSGSKMAVKAASYNIWVGGVQVTDSNKNNIPLGSGNGTATYDTYTNTLFCIGAKITNTYDAGVEGKAGIYVKDTYLTIAGEVTIDLSNETSSYGILMKSTSNPREELVINGKVSIANVGYGIKGEQSNILFKCGKTDIHSTTAALFTYYGDIEFDEGIAIIDPEGVSPYSSANGYTFIRKTSSSAAEKNIVIDKTYGNMGPYTIDLTSGSATITGEQAELVYNTAIFAKKSLILGDSNYLKHPIVFDLDGDSNGDLSVTIVRPEYDFESISFSVLDSCNYYGDFVLTEDDIKLDKLDKYHYSYYSPFTLKLPEKKVPSKPGSTASIDQVSVNGETAANENIDTSIKVPSIKKLTKGKKNITVTWKKADKKLKGYEIQLSTDKEFKENVKSVSVNKIKTTNKTIKKLKSKTKYYVRIRVFRKGDAGKVYSNWSTTKSIKVK